MPPLSSARSHSSAVPAQSRNLSTSRRSQPSAAYQGKVRGRRRQGSSRYLAIGSYDSVTWPSASRTGNDDWLIAWSSSAGSPRGAVYAFRLGWSGGRPTMTSCPAARSGSAPPAVRSVRWRDSSSRLLADHVEERLALLVLDDAQRAPERARQLRRVLDPLA